MKLITLTNANNHTIHTAITTREKRNVVIIDINEWYEFDFYMRFYDIDDWKPESVVNYSDEELIEIAIQAAREIDADIQRKHDEGELQIDLEYIQRQLAKSNIDADIEIVGTYQLTEEIVGNADEEVFYWKAWENIYDDYPSAKALHN